MKSLFYIAALFVLTCCTLSCTHTTRSFDEVERLLQSDPQAAVERLNGYDVSEFEVSATLARWALLYSEAMVANRLVAPRDTIVNIAIDYYGRHGIDDKLARAQALKQQLNRGVGDADALSTARYVQKEKEFQLYKEKARRRQIVLCSLIVGLVALGIIGWQRQRLRLASVRNEALMAEASSLHEGLSRTQTVMSAVLLRRFADIDELCSTYYESAGTKAEQKNISATVKSRITSIREDAKMFAEIENDVNACRKGIAETVKPMLKPEEFRLFVFLACGLSNRAIALLMGESIEVIYKRKSRLKAKITGMDLVEKAAITEVF